MTGNVKYYECHITVSPLEGEGLELFKQYCREESFRVADLIMVKDRKVTEERSNRDSFCTGRSPDYDDLYQRMIHLVERLDNGGFQVWRYKIEAILLDEIRESRLKIKRTPI